MFSAPRTIDLNSIRGPRVTPLLTVRLGLLLRFDARDTMRIMSQGKRRIDVVLCEGVNREFLERQGASRANDPRQIEPGTRMNTLKRLSLTPFTVTAFTTKRDGVFGTPAGID